MPQQPVEVTVRATTSVSPEATFRAAVPINLTLIFRGLGPLPAVTAVRDQTGPWDRPGVSRTPVLSDGGTAHEVITAYEPWSHFAYEVGDFTNVLGRIVHGATGTWDFLPTADGGTAITWTYAFRPRRFRSLLVRLVLAPVWGAYMRRALAATVDEVHRQAARADRPQG